MENINSVLFKAKKYLINNSIKSANIDTEILMCSVLNKSRDHLMLNMLDKIDYEKMKESVFNRGHQLRYYEIRAPAELLTLEITNHIQAIFYKLIEIRHSEGII